MRGARRYCLQRRRRTAGPFGPSEAAARDTGWLLTNGIKDMIYGSILDARTPANCAHARVAVTRTRRGGLPRVPDLIRRPPNCSVENRLNCSVFVFKVLHNSRLRCAAGAHRRAHRVAAGRALPASRGRRSVRTAAAKGQKPTICGLEAPGALRRTPHGAHAGELWHIALCWAGTRAPVKSSGVICVHTPLAAGALVELGAENSRMSEYESAVN